MPNKKKKPKYDKAIKFRVSENDLEQLEELSGYIGVSKSEVFRAAMQYFYSVYFKK